VEQKTLPVVLEASGNIQPWETVFISGQAGTRIENIMAEAGDAVQKGEVLVRMSDERLSQARNQMNLSQTELQRLDTLLQIGSISQQQYDQALTQYQNARSEFRSLQQNVQLTSPINGVISEKYFYEGEVYSPSAQTPSILTVVEIEPVKLVVNLTENFYSQINRGMKTEISVDNFPDRIFTGTINKKYPTIEEATRTFRVEIRIENEESLLRPGMYARVDIPLEEKSGIYIPASAILKQPATSRNYVYTVQADTVQRKQVQTGNRIRDQILITEGLNEGESIITEGLAKVESGDSVRVMN
jgi:RND family efflux transporter MFP subunit